jgi:hypothetical protein
LVFRNNLPRPNAILLISIIVSSFSFWYILVFWFAKTSCLNYFYYSFLILWLLIYSYCCSNFIKVLIYVLHFSLNIVFCHVLRFDNVKCLENDKHFLVIINFIALVYMSKNNWNSKPQNTNIIYINFWVYYIEVYCCFRLLFNFHKSLIILV